MMFVTCPAFTESWRFQLYMFQPMPSIPFSYLLPRSFGSQYVFVTFPLPPFLPLSNLFCHFVLLGCFVLRTFACSRVGVHSLFLCFSSSSFSALLHAFARTIWGLVFKILFHVGSIYITSENIWGFVDWFSCFHLRCSSLHFACCRGKFLSQWCSHFTIWKLIA